MQITIDGNNIGSEYHGLGMISGNNSSGLLIDYKYEHPEIYREILQYIFGADGLNISHLKLEMGSDVNSTSGTEPCVKRFRNETADITRGAGYILAADEDNSWRIADMMITDDKFRDAVDVIGSHYTNHLTENVKTLS